MNFISTFEELDKLYESVDNVLTEAPATGVRLTSDNMHFIETAACEYEKSRNRRNFDNEFFIDCIKNIDPAITFEDLSIAAKNSTCDRQIKTLAAHMKMKGFANFGDFAKSFEVSESIEVATVEEGIISKVASTVAKAVGLKEAADADDEDEEIMVDGEPIVDDEEAPVEEVTEEFKNVVLECAKCGALVVRAEADLAVDEAAGLVNVGEACQYCEAEEGFKIIGTMIPYEAEEAAEEEIIEIIDDEAEVSEEAPEEEAGEELLDEEETEVE